MLVTLDTSQFEMSALKDVAPSNIPFMEVTLDTSHLEISALKDVAPANIQSISVTSDTSHASIRPSGLVAQSPVGDISRHATTALRSCALVFVEGMGDGTPLVVADAGGAEVIMHAVGDIDPCEPSNMLPWFAVESAQEIPHSVWLKDVA